MGTKMSISSLKTELLNESVLTVKLLFFNVDGTEITTWTSDSRLHIPQFYGFHCRRQDTRVSNKSGVYLHAIASPVISHNSSTILRNIARFLTIPCNEIPNFICCLDPDRVHVYKAHSSHRVVKAEPGNIIPGSYNTYSL